MPFLLQQVCLELARIMRHQAESGVYYSNHNLDLLFQLHALLTATWLGKLSFEDWDKTPYKKLLTRLRQPRRRKLLA